MTKLHKHTGRFALLAGLLGVALAIRLFGITDIPMDFHPTKQFRSALTTRAYFYEESPSIEDWRKEVSRDSLRQIGVIVPTVQERVIAAVYSWTGEERLWIGRLLSSVVWLAGGLFVLAVGRHIASDSGAVLGTCLYLLAPFGVLASQSFQPDPLMIGASAASIWLSVHYHSAPSRVRLLLATAAAAAAIFIKPVAAFIVLPAFFGASVGLRNTGRSLRVSEGVLFALLAISPVVLFYFYRVFLAGFDDWHRESSFFPSYVLEFSFWDGWLKRIRISMGFTYFLGGLLGAFLARPGLARSLLAALWLGYFSMCFTLSYKVSTHDYYHLPALLISALSITQLVDSFRDRLVHAKVPSLWRVGAVLTVVIGLLLAAGTSVQARRKLPDFSGQVSVAREIGEAVSHSSKTIFLAQYYGRPLMYYGELSGEAWPYWYDLRDEAIWGGAQQSTSERLQHMLARGQAEYFVVADFEEYARQRDLQQLLEGYPTLVAVTDFIVFDLRGVTTDK